MVHPTTLQWADGGSFAEDRINLTAGTYTVTVTDANACSIIGVYTVPQANVLAGAGYFCSLTPAATTVVSAFRYRQGQQAHSR